MSELSTVVSEAGTIYCCVSATTEENSANMFGYSLFSSSSLFLQDTDREETINCFVFRFFAKISE